MVGPISDDERRTALRRLKLGFVAVIGVSAGLITLQGDAGPVAFVAATGAGLVFGAVLVWVALPGGF